MNISLKPEQENFIRAKLEEGKYQSVDSLLSFGFQLLEEHEAKQQKLSELRKKIAEGAEQIKQGNVVDGISQTSPLQKVVQEIRLEAQRKGFTPEILEEILKDDF